MWRWPGSLEMPGPGAASVLEGPQKGLAQRPRPAAHPAPAKGPCFFGFLVWLLWGPGLGSSLFPRPRPSLPGIPYHLLQELVAKCPLSPTGAHLHTPWCLVASLAPSARSALCLAGSILVILAHSRVSGGRGQLYSYGTQGDGTSHLWSTGHPLGLGCGSSRRAANAHTDGCHTGPASRPHSGRALQTFLVPNHIWGALLSARKGRSWCCLTRQELPASPGATSRGHTWPKRGPCRRSPPDGDDTEPAGVTRDVQASLGRRP